MHISVLLNESIEYLNLKEDSVIIDCTLGYGGHSSNVLKEIKKGFLFAFDQDEEAIKFSNKRLRNVKEVDGILYDLGVSSPQLDQADRGFSFHNDAVLDMRMDKNQSLSALTVVNEYSLSDFIRIFRDYGEEKYASGIAKKIVDYRSNKEIKTTGELVEIIKTGVPEKYRREHHPARKVFQAIRIEVNHELDVFESSLKQALDLIKIGGRICVITFHSLEDRICKNIFKEVSSVPKELAGLPIIPEEYQPKYKVIANIAPTNTEIDENTRSRSARLRVIERVR